MVAAWIQSCTAKSTPPSADGKQRAVPLPLGGVVTTSRYRAALAVGGSGLVVRRGQGEWHPSLLPPTHMVLAADGSGRSNEVQETMTPCSDSVRASKNTAAVTTAVVAVAWI